MEIPQGNFMHHVCHGWRDIHVSGVQRAPYFEVCTCLQTDTSESKQIWPLRCGFFTSFDRESLINPHYPFNLMYFPGGVERKRENKSLLS